MIKPSVQFDAVFTNAGQRRCRVALYSHDTMGLGHMRRNLSIAEALASCEPQPIVLMITGSREIGAFSLPSGVDCLTLPALYKETDGSYQSRCLNVAIDEIRLIREKTISAAIETFKPDILVVDKEPAGAVGELLRPLDSLLRRGHANCVLGLRDVIDDPSVVRNEWNLHNNYKIIRRYYDAVWVYGDASVYDLVEEYRFPHDIAAVTSYTGYLGRLQSDSIEDRDRNFLRSVGLSSERLVICTVGGGQDGSQLARVFLEMYMPPNTCGLLLTGPYMPGDIRQQLHIKSSARSNLRVMDFATRPISLFRQADCLISMGGYNTICEALSLGKRVLVVPRDNPRREQLIRAERMRDLGLLDMLHLDGATPKALGQWLTREKESSASAKAKIDLNGLRRLPEMLSELLRTKRRRSGIVFNPNTVSLMKDELIRDLDRNENTILQQALGTREII